MFVSKEPRVVAIGIFCIIPSCIAVQGVSDKCCELAKDSLAFVNKTVPQGDYTCGQQFSPTNSPAPDLAVSYEWCTDNCPGIALYPPNHTNAWALPLVTFILAAVIFSMTIPRRFGSRTPHLPWKFIVASLVMDALIVVLDTVFWVFAIMIATAPFILSGLFEIIIDIKVTRYVSMVHRQQHQLAEAEVIELLTAVLAGNLNIEGVPIVEGKAANPQEDLKRELDITTPQNDMREKISVRLSNMLDGQVPFSTTVGAPVLLYIGSFIYSILSLSGTKGDKDTARALAFGIWWMIIVHVSVISGSLLASNNPSLASMINPKRREQSSLAQRREYANQRQEMEDRFQAHIEAFAFAPIKLSYDNLYEPVWMWTRGKNKALWLRNTKAWERLWFRERMTLSAPGWIFLTVGSYSLVFLPCALAFWIEYTTPPIGVGCRALTILFYAGCQLIFVVLSAWSHFKAAHGGEHGHEYWQRHSWLNSLRRKRVGISVAVLVFLPTWVVAVLATFLGTLAQITGIFQNCWCGASFHANVSLASDTEEDRRSSRNWNIAGYVAAGFLFVITYGSWWCQRFLRDVFLKRVELLRQEQSDNQPTVGAISQIQVRHHPLPRLRS